MSCRNSIEVSIKPLLSPTYKMGSVSADSFLFFAPDSCIKIQVLYNRDQCMNHAEIVFELAKVIHWFPDAGFKMIS